MRYIFILILALAFFSLSADAQDQSESRSKTAKPNKDMLAVQKASEAFIKAFNDLEWETFRNSFSDDATVFLPFWQASPIANGKAQMEAAFKPFFDDIRKRKPNPPYLNIQPKDVRIQMLKKDAAILTFHLGENSPIGRRTLVFRKEKGKWLIAHMHASSIEKPK